MAKYSFEFKKKIVLAFLNKEGGYAYLAKKYSVASKINIKNWIKVYNEFGDEGLMRSRKKVNYSFEFKLHVVELYLTTEVSYQELALSVGMNNPPLITKWVNDFRFAGPDALRLKRKGQRRNMDKPKDIKPAIDINSNYTPEYIKQLEDDLLKLKIENAYLKELRRLRLEDKARLREQLESSTASEENSN
jgi:transposase